MEIQSFASNAVGNILTCIRIFTHIAVAFPSLLDMSTICFFRMHVLPEKDIERATVPGSNWSFRNMEFFLPVGRHTVPHLGYPAFMLPRRTVLLHVGNGS